MRCAEMRAGVAIFMIAALACVCACWVSATAVDSRSVQISPSLVSFGLGHPLPSLDNKHSSQFRTFRNSSPDALQLPDMGADIAPLTWRAHVLEPVQVPQSAYRRSAPPRAPPQVASLTLT